MLDNTQYLSIGKFGSAHGIRGLVKINSFTSPASNILSYAPFYISSKDDYKIIDLSISLFSNKLIATIANVNDRNTALSYVNQLLYIKKDSIALQKNEYLWSDLIGLTVLDENTGATLGTIDAMMPAGGKDAVILDTKKSFSFCLKNIIKSIDIKQNTMIIDSTYLV